MRVGTWQVFLLTVGILALGLSQPCGGQATAASSDDIQALREDIRRLQTGQQAIQRELQAIKDLLSARAKRASPVRDISVTFAVNDLPAKGQEDARLTLVEFTDYQCPYCARHARTVLPSLIKEFIDTGQVRYVLRDFPLPSIHPQAAKAHEAAHCAGEQGRYWAMHDQLFAHQQDLQADQLAGHATAVGVADSSAFEACLASGKYQSQTKAGVTQGTKLGVSGTPSFILGRTEPDGGVKGVKLIRGAQQLAVFQREIDELLNSP